MLQSKVCSEGAETVVSLPHLYHTQALAIGVVQIVAHGTLHAPRRWIVANHEAVVLAGCRDVQKSSGRACAQPDVHCKGQNPTSPTSDPSHDMYCLEEA